MTACHHPRGGFIHVIAFLVIAWMLGVNNASSSNNPTRLPASSSSSTNHLTTTTAQHPNNNNFNATQPHGYEIVKEKLVYKGWRTITQRLVRMPNGNHVTFDIVGQGGANMAVMIFAWNTYTKTVTLVREYNPACHFRQIGLAAGLVENNTKHNNSNPLVAAQHELEEECHLTGGMWYVLTTPPIVMDKYASTKLHVYLVLDPQHVHDPKPLDDEEDIEIVRNVTIDELFCMMKRGEMNVVGSFASLLAIEKLRELNEIP